MKEKRLPKGIIIFLGLWGYILGASTVFIAVAIGVGLNRFFDGLLASIGIIMLSIVALLIIQWGYSEVLLKWGLINPKKKEVKA